MINFLSDYPHLNNKYKKLVGISSTVPIEVIYSGGFVALDLNNIFISSPSPLELLKKSTEFAPRAVCSWTRGVLAAAVFLKLKNAVIVTEGDCAHTIPITDILAYRNMNVFSFEYPLNHDFNRLKNEIDRFIEYYKTDISSCEKIKEEFDRCRAVLKKIDDLTYKELKVSGFENHLNLVSASDFNCDPVLFYKNAREFLNEAEKRPSKSVSLRIGHAGIPPIFSDYYNYISSLGSEVIYNETQRQFSMIDGVGRDLYGAYHNYTYPYSFQNRLKDIKKAISERELDCLIHYVQSFCFHQIEDRMLKNELGDFPLLTIEGDYPAPLNENDRLKIESFISSVERKKYKLKSKKINLLNRKNYAAGIDLGSRSVKIVCYGRNEHKFEIFETMDFIIKYLSGENKKKSFDKFQADILKLSGAENISKIEYFSTGYGRYRASVFDAKPFSEIECHAAGAIYSTGLKNFTLLDVGGQDIKVIEVKNGAIKGFSMNDKCAAGSGRYIENMARILKADLGEISKHYREPEPLSITCATFGETELIAKLIAGVDIKKIMAGVNYTVYARIEPLLNEHRSPSGALVVTSGITHNAAFLEFLKSESGFKKIIIPKNAQFMGAIGAAALGVS
jgi:predicted CoA-substrate-specific enzyme activase